MPSPSPITARRERAGTRSFRAFIAGGILLLFLGGPAAAENTPARRWLAPVGRQLGAPLLRFAAGDTIEIVARRLAPPPLIPSYSMTTPQYHRSIAFSVLSHPRTYERPRLARVIFGADQMAGTGAALAGLGLVGGICDDRTAGCLVGAGAILGALWGGTMGADEPGIRLGVDPGSYGNPRREVRLTE